MSHMYLLNIPFLSSGRTVVVEGVEGVEGGEGVEGEEVVLPVKLVSGCGSMLEMNFLM